MDKVSQEVMLESNVKGSQFVIGSISIYGFSIANRPVVHDDVDSARKEAERLAKLNPVSKYVVLEVNGVVAANAVVWK